ncbi:MAG TPA: lysophospholipid acyltransferase family protein [Candidatus Omnitrophota bacterium]|jgi:1-acyl-sn-glycerol-3-phosphate acyltransferase|nr:lysophospholipid acyltransferase family protein [Candidatus Omnitrophota bacterium]HRY85737.1 lysophospholipid acyltransferase family protein [Candidatus Omnitrophota bacterium]
MKILKNRVFGFWDGLFYSLLIWSVVCIFTTLFAVLDIFVIFPISLIFDRGTGWKIHQTSIIWSRAIIRGSGIWRMVVKGREHLQKGKRYIVVANHQSLIDILVACAALPIHFKFLAKRELFFIPFMGWAMALAGYIPVDRASHKSGRSAMQRISAVLKKGISVLLFPEGTRSPDGKIHAFKMGAFKLAKDNGVEILPVVMDGTGQALPKKSWLIKHKSTFVVSIGKPVSLADLGDSSLEEMKEKIRHEMIGRLEKIRHHE